MARRKGFTLIELLVVVAIIAILAAMLTPALMLALRKAHEASTRNLIHQCQVAAQAFFNDKGDYPPSYWHQVDELFKYDSNNPAGTGIPDGVYNRADDEVWFADGTTHAGFEPPPTTTNEGIEVFLACLATRSGGPYLDLSDKQLGNTDGDTVSPNGTLAAMVNWYFKADQTGTVRVFEIVDWWGNPLTYLHNRDYTDHDGWLPATSLYENPATGTEMLRYAVPEDLTWKDSDHGGTHSIARGLEAFCYGRSTEHFKTGNFPNLDSFQLYSWGDDMLAGCGEQENAARIPIGVPDPNSSGGWPGWDGRSGNLTNWEE
jgi:prepilin-type N-terminal cleavage/methylation domain-containing protein